MQFQPTVGRAFVCVCMCVYVCVSMLVCMRVCMCVCMHVSPLHFVSIVQVGNKRFREFEKMGYGRTDGPTDERTDGPADGQILL